MKLLIVVCVLVVAVLADDPHGLHAVFEKCQGNPETHVDESVYKELKKTKGEAPVPENFGKHVLCLAKGLNIVSEEGKVSVEGVKTHVGHVIKEADKVDAIVKKCAVDLATPEETSRQVWKCLYENHVFEGHHGHGHAHSSEESDENGEHHHGHGHNHSHH